MKLVSPHQTRLRGHKGQLAESGAPLDPTGPCRAGGWAGSLEPAPRPAYELSDCW